jgi:methyl-accepting chemotaxis protein
VAQHSERLLLELVPSIQKTANLVQEGATASSAHAAGVQQITLAMRQIDQVTQRSAAASEELAATSEEIAAQAESLRQLMAYFKLTPEQPHLERLAPQSLAVSQGNRGLWQAPVQ